MDKINLADKFKLISKYWSPKIIGESNGSYIKLAKFLGEFTWHKHDDADEMFFVVKGSIVIQLRDKNIQVNQGELFVVPQGVEHCPLAEQEAHVMLIEPKSVINTGDVTNEKTVKDLDWI